jgi:diguanylate cyclase (GGDEF)-like protein/PAS domain S-box-containing protein
MTEEQKWKTLYEKEKLQKEELQRVLETRTQELYDLNQRLLSQKNELETIFETTIDGIAILDLKSNFLFVNNAYQVMSGYTKEELLGSSCIELSAKEDQEKTKKALEIALEKGYLEHFEKTCIKKDGEKLIFHMSIAMMPDKQSFLITTKDVTEIKNKERLISSYVNLIDHNIITSSTDLTGKITYASHAFCNISGYSADELMGQNHRIIRHPDMPNEFFKEMWESLSNDITWEGEIKNLKKDGSYYWVYASISPVFNEKNKKIGYTAIRQDITSKKRIEEISITDGLTGIYNRRHFDDIFPKVINSAKRNNGLVSFLILDIDYFKQYNDTYGHQMGDEVLKKVALMIKNSLKRAGDYCFRLGGEEFGVIFEVDRQDKAITFANIIRQNIEALQIQHSKSCIGCYITASMGLICKNANQIKDQDEEYKIADKLLYEAKESGRNRVVFSD